MTASLGRSLLLVGRNWDGPVDHEVGVIRIDDSDGEPIAAIVNYACHPITVGPDGDLITPDYPGVVKRVVEASTGATCLFLQGATGDIGPIRGGARNGLNEYKRLGTLLGLEASRVWWETEVPELEEKYHGTLESGAPLAIYTDEPKQTPGGNENTLVKVGLREVQLPAKQLPPPDELEAEFQEHLRRLNELRETNGSEEDIKWETMRCKRSSMRAELAKRNQGKTHRTVEVQALVLGDDVALIAVPGEPFAEIGMRVKAGSPFKNTLFSGYSNVGGSYIPMEYSYEQGGYEVEITPYSPGAAEKLAEECVALLHEMADRSKSTVQD